MVVTGEAGSQKNYLRISLGHAKMEPRWFSANWRRDIL